MKVKLGFITNSSSTMHVVFIPNSYKISSFDVSRMVQVIVNNMTSSVPNFTFNEDDEEKLVEYILEDLESIKEGEQFCYNTGSTYSVIEWGVLMKICEDNGFFMTSVSLPNDGGEALIGVTQESLIATLVAHIDLDEFMKPFILEEK